MQFILSCQKDIKLSQYTNNSAAVLIKRIILCISLIKITSFLQFHFQRVVSVFLLHVHAATLVTMSHKPGAITNIFQAFFTHFCSFCPALSPAESMSELSQMRDTAERTVWSLGCGVTNNSVWWRKNKAKQRSDTSVFCPENKTKYLRLCLTYEIFNRSL